MARKKVRFDSESPTPAPRKDVITDEEVRANYGDAFGTYYIEGYQPEQPVSPSRAARKASRRSNLVRVADPWASKSKKAAGTTGSDEALSGRPKNAKKPAAQSEDTAQPPSPARVVATADKPLPKIILRLRKKAPMSTNVSSPSNDGGESDTITVQHKVAGANIKNPIDDEADDSPLSDLEEIERQLEARPSPQQQRVFVPKSGLSEKQKGKQPAADQGDGDFEIIDNEPCPEAEIDYYEQTDPESEDNKFSDDAKSVISISSNDEEEKMGFNYGMNNKPWMVEGFNKQMRATWENMYCEVTTAPLGNSWEITEDYQREKDKEMLKYMEDFPLPTWVIPKEQAEQAYFRLLERSRWRSLGIRIYGPRRIPEMIPNSTPYSSVTQRNPSQYPVPVNPTQYPRQPSVPGMPANLPQQQHMAHRPLVQGMPPPPQSPLGMPPPHGMHPQGMPPQGMPPHGMPPPPRAMQPPTPQQMLPSQPNAQPIGVPPGPRPMSGQQMMHTPSQQQQQYSMQMAAQGQMMHGMPMQYSMQNPGGPHQFNQQYHAAHASVPMHAPPPGYGAQNPAPVYNGHAANAARVPRRKKDTSPPATLLPAPPTPPYKLEPRPVPRKEYNNNGNKNKRRQAEAVEFPWHRQNFDFHKAKAEAKWDDSMYDPKILDAMARVREKNFPAINKLDEVAAEKQRQSRRKNNKSSGGQSSDAEGEPKKKAVRRKDNTGGDIYHSGQFAFVSPEDEMKGLALKLKTPDDIIKAAENGKIDWEVCKNIYVCWNPGKKGMTQGLEHAVFRIYDTLATRKQLKDTPMLTRRAAECIVDFCPDLLWRETLLRLISEAGYGNKDVRDRYALNGCWIDKATVTKRIGAALGAKQQNNTKTKEVVETEVPDEAEGSKKKRRGPPKKEKAERYMEGEYEWYMGNKADFENYIRFFGKRVTHRVNRAGEKRKQSEGPEGEEVEGPSKRAKSEVSTTEDVVSPLSSGLSESRDEEEGDVEEESGEENDEEDDEDAVSVQDSDVLDEIED